MPTLDPVMTIVARHLPISQRVWLETPWELGQYLVRYVIDGWQLRGPGESLLDTSPVPLRDQIQTEMVALERDYLVRAAMALYHNVYLTYNTWKVPKQKWDATTQRQIDHARASSWLLALVLEALNAQDDAAAQL